MGKGTDLAVGAEQVRELARNIGIPVGLVEPADMAATNEDILAELLNTGSLEGVLAAGQVESLEDYTGHVVTFLDVKWQPSTFENEDALDLPYAVSTITDATGKRHVVTCGASKVVIALGYAKRDNAFPFEARVVRNETRSGRRVLSLAAPTVA